MMQCVAHAHASSLIVDLSIYIVTIIRQQQGVQMHDAINVWIMHSSLIVQLCIHHDDHAST